MGLGCKCESAPGALEHYAQLVRLRQALRHHTLGRSMDYVIEVARRKREIANIARDGEQRSVACQVRSTGEKCVWMPAENHQACLEAGFSVEMEKARCRRSRFRP